MSEEEVQKLFKASQNIKHKNILLLNSLRHFFASHLIERGVDIKIAQELLGHVSIKTNQIYTHVVMKKLESIKSQLDNLDI